MTTSVHAIAKFIVRNSSTQISNLKLQKLLYYTQGWHLGMWKTPIFNAEIQAWIHGPVVPEVFREYRDYKWTPIADLPGTISIDSHAETHIKAVLRAYGRLTAAQLEALSHKESPWILARKGLGPTEPSTQEISHESMRRFFSKKANG